FNRAWPGHQDYLVSTNRDTVGKAHDRPFRTEGTGNKLVGRTDAVDLAHSGKHLDIPDIKLTASAHCAQHGLARSCGAVNFKTHLNQALDYLLYLLFRCLLLHCYDHSFALDRPLVKFENLRMNIAARK